MIPSALEKREGKTGIINFLTRYAIRLVEAFHSKALNLPAGKSKLFITTRKCFQSTFMLVNSSTNSPVFAVSVESTEAYPKSFKFSSVFSPKQRGNKDKKLSCPTGRFFSPGIW